MLTLQRTDDTYIAYQNDRRIGSLRLYDNPHHMRNCYVKLELDELDTGISAGLFKELRKIAGRPLQVMVDSDNAELIAFLLSGGFVCRRKCYEVEAGIEDYIGGQANVPLEHCRVGEPDYEAACRMLFEHYTETHKAVNPWTADFETFCDELPEDVICSKQGGKIVSLAFVEENEIAYVCGADEPYFRLKHDLQGLSTPVLLDGFSICNATPEDFALHINKSYTGIGISAEELRRYTERPVYHPALWLAVKDDRTGEIVATGIAELDREIGEGILEWIQVSKEYRGCGLGNFVVSELLWKMKDLAKFATVSGQCENSTNPEALYRKCGFKCNDVWHILRKR